MRHPILPPRMEARRLSWRFVLASVAVLAMLAAMPRTVMAEANPAELKQLVDSYVENRNFNGVVLVAQHGRVVYRAAHGLANREWQVPSTADGVFRIGSLTKPITAMLVLQLVQEGKIELDGTLGGYLPELYGETPSAAVTVAQLLHHTSGITDLPGNYNDPWWQTQARQSFTPEALAKAWIPGTLQTAPGTAWRYNNAGYLLLGLIVEKSTGESYEANLRRRILDKAGMTESGVYHAGDVIPRLAAGYETRPDLSLVQPMPIDPSILFAAAGAYATADDLFRLDRALYDDTVLAEHWRRAMWTDHGSGYGYGWGVDTWTSPSTGDYTVLSHTGSVPGYQSYWLRAEQDASTVIILDNYWQGITVATLGQDLMQVLHGKPMVPVKKSLGDLLVPAAMAQGVQGMTRAYRSLGAGASQYDLSESALNTVGYRLLRMQRVPEAVQVFQWNVTAHPGSANVHDSLGEAYRANGQSDQAIRSYREAARLAPDNARVREVLKELGAR